MLGKNSKKVSNIVHLEIRFDIETITALLQDDFHGDLLSGGWESPHYLSYQIDVIPHPDGVNSFFYHRKSNCFSNYLSALEKFESDSWGGSRIEQWPKLGEVLRSVEWDLYDSGHFRVFLEPAVGETRPKLAIITPMSEAAQLQIEGILSTDLSEDSESVMEVGDETESIKVIRKRMGLKKVSYRNALCEVGICIPDEYTDYSS